ncbi:MAG: hypothetical protein K8S25_04910 [Alphaproteobacteria bacterium]|nr:hypothetical protein [Alphaproteobacteria bacterium]
MKIDARTTVANRGLTRVMAPAINEQFSPQRGTPTVLFRSRREPLLWLATLLSLLPIALVICLLILNAKAQFPDEIPGGAIGLWLFRGTLVLASTVLFWPMVWLSGRYVLRSEETADGHVNFSTWTLLGHDFRHWAGPSLNAPAIWFEEDPTRLPSIFQGARSVLRNLLMALMGRRKRLWLGGPIVHEGRTDIPLQVSVDAPYISVYPATGKQLLIDLQGEFPSGQDAFLEAIKPKIPVG